MKQKIKVYKKGFFKNKLVHNTEMLPEEELKEKEEKLLFMYPTNKYKYVYLKETK